MPGSAPTAAAVRWQWAPFAALSGTEVHALLQLRSAVFVVEQQCVFLDADGTDPQAMHLLGWEPGAAGRTDRLVACARCFPAGAKFPEAMVGRIVTAVDRRGTGLGDVLVKEAIARLHGEWGAQPIRIAAQTRLERFYQRHGFATAGAPYIEDNIPHLQMLRGA